MRIPDWWQALILALGTFRLVRLVSYDSFPPLVRVRNRVTGAEWDQDAGEGGEGEWAYRRPVLAELFSCAYCFGLWLSLGVYVLWLASPAAAVYAAFPLALSAAIGIIARWLDP